MEELDDEYFDNAINHLKKSILCGQVCLIFCVIIVLFITCLECYYNIYCRETFNKIGWFCLWGEYRVIVNVKKQISIQKEEMMLLAFGSYPDNFEKSTDFYELEIKPFIEQIKAFLSFFRKM